jgi:hypothetical protein
VSEHEYHVQGDFAGERSDLYVAGHCGYGFGYGQWHLYGKRRYCGRQAGDGVCPPDHEWDNLPIEYFRHRIGYGECLAGESVGYGGLALWDGYGGVESVIIGCGDRLVCGVERWVSVVRWKQHLHHAVDYGE